MRNSLVDENQASGKWAISGIDASGQTPGTWRARSCGSFKRWIRRSYARSLFKATMETTVRGLAWSESSLSKEEARNVCYLREFGPREHADHLDAPLCSHRAPSWYPA